MLGKAPELTVNEWVNDTVHTQCSETLASLTGSVVIIQVFQMLCPACVSHLIPQTNRIRQYFRRSDLEVIGLHSVFEHHHRMPKELLEAFAVANKLKFPIAIDKHKPNNPTPLTMQKYYMQGTPTSLLIDKRGELRLHHFGKLTDLRVGAEIATLIAE